MQALILANGKGTNLRPLTVYTPKPVIPVVNTPLLLYQIEILKRAGVEQITLFLDYQPGKIEHLLGHEQELGVELRYVVEPQPLGTAGAYKFASKYSRETTVVLNGDVLTDFVISRLLNRHSEIGADFTIAAVPVRPNPRYGVLKVNEDSRIVDYIPDPQKSEESLDDFDLMNAGIYVIEPNVADFVSEQKPLSFKYDVIPDMIEQERSLAAFRIEGSYWSAIDSLEEYLNVHRDFLAGKARNFKMDRANGYERATSAFIDEESVIGPDCDIKPNARIINSVLSRGVKVGEGALIENSVVWAHSRISNSAKISESILASSCYVGKNAIVSKGAVLGDKASLTDYSKV